MSVGRGPKALGALALALATHSIATRAAHAQQPQAQHRRHRRPAHETPPDEERVATVRTSVVRDRTVSEYVIPASRYDVVPRSNAGDVVSLTPGTWVSQDNGEGHAQHIYLRGFFSEDGSDVAVSVDGVPLNQVGHPEHHGLVDLATVIPELIQRVDATAGVADPRQGDFAVAGSMDLHLGLHDRGVMERATVGSFGYARLAGFWGPRGMGEDTFVGAEVVRGDGFGPARAFNRINAMGQVALRLPERGTLRLLAGVFSSRFEAPGPVREDDVEAGRVDFFGAYPANASGLGGANGGALGSATFEWQRRLQRVEARVYVLARDARLAEDFTGFVDHPVQGDRTGYGYTVGTLGGSGFYRRSAVLAGRSQDLEVGWNARLDRYVASVRALDANGAPLAPLDPRDTSSSSSVFAFGSYADLVARPWSWLTLRGGARVDLASYDAFVTTNDAPAGPTVAHSQTVGARAGPKATVDFHLPRGFSVIASYGSGFRSPDPLEVATGQPFVFGSVSGEDVGVRWTTPSEMLPGVQWLTTLTGFHTSVDNDVAFDPTTGEAAPIGPTDRVGASLWSRVRWRGLDVSGAVTYTYAIAERDALSGQVRGGMQLPYLPALVARVDAALDQPVTTVRRLPLAIRAGLDAGVRSAPPTIGVASFPSFLLDAALGARLGPVALDLAMRNALDLRVRDAQFEYPSTFVPGGTPSTALHFTAGAPRTVFLTLTLRE